MICCMSFWSAEPTERPLLICNKRKRPKKPRKKNDISTVRADTTGVVLNHLKPSYQYLPRELHASLESPSSQRL
uniref:Uncharacterized protein n=1 Tax=Macaca nemestrina TaxID=9545 RepID=A0A2K6BRY2_MACNE